MPDAQIFSPYIVTSLSDTDVEMKLSKSRTYLLMFLLRVFPVLLFTLVSFIGYGSRDIPGAVKWVYPACGLLLCLMLWAKELLHLFQSTGME